MNEYLNTLLEQIRCKKVRPYIRQELQDHIENQIEENIHAGMDYESAEKEAVKDMGDPIQTGISLDRIHKPQIAWKLLFMIALLSVVGIITHIMITRHIDVAEASISGKYVIHVIVGIAVMMGLYFVDYTLLAKVSKLIAVILIGVCLWTLFFGVSLNGKTYWIVIGRWSVSMPALMLFYIPIYGGVLYKYYGSGYSGLIKAAVWMVIPVLLVLQMPATMSAGLMLITMLVMLTIAIQKEWFAVNKKKAIVALWGIFMVLPVISFIGMYFGNLESNKFIGSNSTGISRTFPSFNGDYILTYLSSTYGMTAAILVCCILTVMIFFIFGTALKQKNQLGMMMGCGCGMIFLVSFIINILENLGVLPLTETFFPFLSAGGSYIIVSYGLTGIILSIYRYKNIYPRHVKVKMPRIKMTIEL